MPKIKNNPLIIASLVLAITLCFSAIFAKAESVNQVNINANQTNINENQDNINKNQADINKKQADVNKNQADVNKNQGNNNQFNGTEHRSTVAIFVQSLLSVADREQGGIGDQVRTIAKEQNDSKDNVANEIDKIKNRSGFKTFFIGSDYKNIGQLRSEMVKTENQIGRLNRLLNATTTSEEGKTVLREQIQALERERQNIDDFLGVNESKFSLFGWFVKLFNK